MVTKLIYISVGMVTKLIYSSVGMVTKLIYSSVGTVTKLRSRIPRYHGSILGRGRRFIVVSQRLAVNQLPIQWQTGATSPREGDGLR